MDDKKFVTLADQKAVSTEEKKYRRITNYIETTTSEIKHALIERRKSVEEVMQPELVMGRSEILDYDDIRNIETNLKSKTGPWNLCFSTSLDGYSLPKLYSKMEGLSGPVLLIIKDKNKKVYGALLSDSIHLSEDYYGNLESFIFTLQPKFQIYKSTKQNSNFIKAHIEGLSIGSKDCGKKEQHALWVGPDMMEGNTQTSGTFGNPPLVTENNGKFNIKSLECWYFSYLVDVQNNK